MSASRFSIMSDEGYGTAKGTSSGSERSNGRSVDETRTGGGSAWSESAHGSVCEHALDDVSEDEDEASYTLTHNTSLQVRGPFPTATQNSVPFPIFGAVDPQASRIHFSESVRITGGISAPFPQKPGGRSRSSSGEYYREVESMISRSSTPTSLYAPLLNPSQTAPTPRRASYYTFAGKSYGCGTYKELLKKQQEAADRQRGIRKPTPDTLWKRLKNIVCCGWGGEEED